MRILGMYFSHKGEGYVCLSPETDEDIWHIYNLILVGDLIKTKVTRKIQHVNKIGIKQADRKVITTTFQIIKIDYHTDKGVELEIQAKNVTENKYIKMGAF